MATLEEIAQAAGVSPMTVSNVLNGKNKETWPSTARRAAMIRDLAEKMNYRPNAAAKAVATGRFNAIGLLSSNDISSGHMFQETLRAIRLELSERDMHLTMGDLPDEKLTNEGFVPKILREWAADGLLISYIASIPARMIELCQQHHIPSIWMNTKLEGDCVYPDDLSGAKQATSHLIEMGHRRIAYVNQTNSSHYSVPDRRNGYLEAMQDARLEPHIIDYEAPRIDSSLHEQSRQWLSLANRPTAVLAYETIHALPVYCAALEMGLQVPRDLSIVTIHDEPVIEVGRPLTTLVIPSYEIGRTAVQMVFQKISDPLESLPPQALPFSLFEGSTCAPPL